MNRLTRLRPLRSSNAAWQVTGFVSSGRANFAVGFDQCRFNGAVVRRFSESGIMSESCNSSKEKIVQSAAERTSEGEKTSKQTSMQKTPKRNGSGSNTSRSLISKEGQLNDKLWRANTGEEVLRIVNKEVLEKAFVNGELVHAALLPRNKIAPLDGVILSTTIWQLFRLPPGNVKRSAIYNSTEFHNVMVLVSWYKFSKPREIQQTVTGLSKIESKAIAPIPNEVFGNLVSCCVGVIGKMTTAELASVLSGFARLGCSINTPDFWKECNRHLVMNRDKVKMKDISRILWAMSKLAKIYKHPNVKFILEKLCQPNLYQSDARSLSVMLQAIANLEFYPSPTFWEDLELVLINQFDACSPRELANIISSMSFVCYQPSRWFWSGFQMAVLEVLPKFSSDDYVYLIRGIAYLRCPLDGILWKELQEAVVDKNFKVNASQLVMVLESLAKCTSEPSKDTVLHIESEMFPKLLPFADEILETQLLENMHAIKVRIGLEMPAEEYSQEPDTFLCDNQEPNTSTDSEREVKLR